jgi:hypothetical protein
MPSKAYHKLNIRPEDYIIFRQLKHRLEIDDDIDAFAEMMRIVKEKLNDGNKELVADGVTG